MVAETDAKPRRKRLTAENRRHAILEAARTAFSKTGDMNGTTVKMIAAQAKISEGVLYHHFESKDEMFFEAIVEPLHRSIGTVVEEVSDYDPASFSDKELEEMTSRFWTSMISSLEKILPLFGLVLFGEPKRAKRFYLGSFNDAIDQLAATWQRIYDEYDMPYPARDVALSTLGIALAFALDARYRKGGNDLQAVADKLVPITRHGFWPPIDTAKLKR
jgi:AcrR family transcriptional regulator